MKKKNTKTEKPLHENSKAQSWELEVTCKDRKYLNAVVKAILKYGMMEFEVNTVDCYSYAD